MKTIILLLLLSILWSCSNEGTEKNDEHEVSINSADNQVNQTVENNDAMKTQEREALFALAINEEKKGELEKAVEMHEEILAEDPTYAKSYPVLAGLYSSLGKTKEALKYGKKALEQAPSDIDLLNTMGMVYMEADDYRNALEYFNTVIELAPRYAYAYNNKGYILLKQKEYDLALLSIEKSLALDSDNAYAYRNAAICYQHKGDKEACCEALTAATKARFRHRLKEELQSMKDKFCR